MTQTDVVKDLAKRELADLKKDPEVKKALFLVKRIKSSNPISERGRKGIKSLHKEYLQIRKDNPRIKRALILNSIV